MLIYMMMRMGPPCHLPTFRKSNADQFFCSVIASLPPALPTNADDQSSPGSRSLSRRSVLESDDLATRYGRLLRELRLLSARRKDAEVRKEQAKALLEVLAPLRNPNESVQGNLVIEDGELVAELVRMRGLLTRIREGF